jgi:hypothetical protein
VTTVKQLAITKTPKQHGTYCLRLKLADGAMLEYISHRAQTFEELIDALQKRVADVQRVAATGVEPSA